MSSERQSWPKRDWKGQPLAQWTQTRRAVWRMRAPSLNTRLRSVSICAERNAGGKRRRNRFTHGAVREQLEGRGVAQAVGVVGVFIPSHDLIQTLPQQAGQRMVHLVRAPRVAQGPHQTGRQPALVIELPQRQQPGVGSDLAALEIGGQLAGGVERKGDL